MSQALVLASPNAAIGRGRQKQKKEKYKGRNSCRDKLIIGHMYA